MPSASQTTTYTEEIPTDARLLQTSEYEMRWGDMDAFGHVNNAMYFTYFEQVRIDWVRSIGHEHGLVMANISCTFLQPLKYPATLQVRLYAGKPGRSSLDTWYDIRDMENLDTLISIGHGAMIWFDHEQGCSVEIPEDVRARLV